MYHNFNTKLRESLYKKIDAALKQSEGPLYAAFDADGTIWEFDMGDEFFYYQIDNCNLALPENPKHYYKSLKQKNPPEAYLWLAQINEGRSLEQVRTWATECFNSLEVPFFPAQKELISYLKANKVEVYIVTASIKWAVEPGARALGLSDDNVIGVSTKIENGIITNTQDGPITYKEGKALALLQKTKGIKPILCSGNTMGDKNLLAAASNISLAVNSAAKDTENYSTEWELNQLAQNNSWYTHCFK